MKKIRKNPPHMASAILERIIEEDIGYGAMGDFEEQYHGMLRECGSFTADLLYWAQVIAALPGFIRNIVYWRAVMFKNYIKIALRNIRKHKGYSFINIMGLAIGMACCILILMWVQDELNFDRFHENYHQLHRTIPRMNDRNYSSNPLSLAPIFKKDYPEVLRISRYAPRWWLFKSGDKSFNENGALVDDDFLYMMTFSLVKGSPESVFQGTQSVVITERMAARYFGAEDPVGKSFLIENDTELMVTGVLKDIPSNSHIDFDFLASMRLMGERANTSWSYEVATYVLLQENTSLPDFSEKISGFIMKYDKRTNEVVTLGIQPMSRFHLYSLNGTHPVIYVYIFLTIAVLILLIACINFINLSTARSNIRAKEIGMRKVVGAVKTDIIRQFFGESTLLSVIALLLAVGLVYLFLPAFNTLSGKQLTLSVFGSVPNLLGLIGIALVTGVIAGSYPAMMLSSFKPVNVFKGALKSGTRGYVLRRILVVSQFTATVILIVGTLIMYKQLNFIKNRNLGLETEHIVTIGMNSELRENSRSFKNEIKQNNNVLAVTAARSTPTRIYHINPVYWEGRGPEQYKVINDAAVDYDYFETFNMEIIAGRSFSETYPTDPQNYILNEEALKLTGLEDPIGKMYSVWEDEGKIIGIVKNFHSRPLHSEITPVVFTLSQRHGSYNNFYVKIRPDNVPETVAYLEEKATEFAPNYPFEYRFLDDMVDHQYRSDRRTGSIYRYFTFLAVFISCLGLFGMASFVTEQRTKEIGIRKVLGASMANIMLLISREFVLLIATANLIAWPIAYFIMVRMLNNYAYRTGITAWIFFAAGITAIGMALLTICAKVIRAALARPVDSLRYE